MKCFLRRVNATALHILVLLCGGTWTTSLLLHRFLQKGENAQDIFALILGNTFPLCVVFPYLLSLLAELVRAYGRSICHDINQRALFEKWVDRIFVVLVMIFFYLTFEMGNRP